MAHYPGTLAAARCLAGASVPVDVVADRHLALAAWSRSAARTIPCPRMDDPRAMLSWLLSVGPRVRGAVLHPTCDDLAWLIARHAEELAVHFRLFTAPYGALRRLLDKSLLYEAARAAELCVPATWLPSTDREVERLALEHEFLVIKPRSQVFYESRAKGEVVRGPENALRTFRRYRGSPYSLAVRSDCPDVQQPMLQEYVPAAAHSVYSLTGFVDRQGRIIGPRGARKVLQWPRLGVGLCFESAEVDLTLVEKLAQLCKSIGYIGVFEAEFIPQGARRLLIDFNPRYYGQMAFDIARGVPLPWMLHLGATGRESDIAAPEPQEPRAHKSAYHDAIALQWLLALGRLARGVNAEDARHWRRWLSEHKETAVDAVISSDDILPAVAKATGTVVNALVHPRSSLRSLQARP